MSEPKRMVVALEGANVNNCVILPGALHCDDDVIPVNWNGDHNHLIGRASKMERNGNEVTMEIDLDEGIHLDLEDKIGGYVYVQPFTAKESPLMKGAISEVTEGRIRAVSLQDLEPTAGRNPAGNLPNG